MNNIKKKLLYYNFKILNGKKAKIINATAGIKLDALWKIFMNVTNKTIVKKEK